MIYHEEIEDGLFVGRGFLENGKKEGVWNYFYDTGELKQETEYSDGIENGLYKFFSKDGALLIISTHRNGLLNGEWTEYYEDGRLKEIGYYNDNEYSPMDFWDNEGNQILKNGTGKKIEEYGSTLLVDVYEQYYNEGQFVKEIKIQSYKVLGFSPKDKK